MPEKHADADLQLDVDIMILDYLMYMATTALLEEANAQMRKGSRNDNDDNVAKRRHNHLAVDQANEENFNDDDDNNDDNVGTEPKLAISMVDSFLRSFQLRHPSACVAKNLKLRLKLLRLTCLFTCRLSRCESTPSREELEELRRANRKRAERFNLSSSAIFCGGSRKRKRKRDSIAVSTAAPTLSQNFNPAFVQELPLSDEILQRNRELTLNDLSIPTSSPVSVPPTSSSPSSSPSSSSSSPPSSPSHLSTATSSKIFYGTPDSVSLLDLLPFFISTSAARANLGSEAEEFVVQPRWMELAAEWMLQAVLEQYRIFGAEGTDVIEEAFAWGYSGAVNDGGRGGSGWKEVKEGDKAEGKDSREVDYEEEWMTSAIFARDVDGSKEENRVRDGDSPTVEDEDDDDDDNNTIYSTKQVENETWTRLKREYVQKVGTTRTRNN